MPASCMKNLPETDMPRLQACYLKVTHIMKFTPASRDLVVGPEVNHLRPLGRFHVVDCGILRIPRTAGAGPSLLSLEEGHDEKRRAIPSAAAAVGLRVRPPARACAGT